MQLTHAQIQNFRSVEDSEKFSLDPDITCLVGKNESGKTTLLTALYRLNPIFDSKFDQQKDYPRRFLADYSERHNGANAEVIKTWWTIEPDERAAVAAKLGNAALLSDSVSVSKTYNNPSQLWNVQIDERAVVQHLVATSELHDEEKEKIGLVTKVLDLKQKVTSLSESSPRQTQLIQRIDQDFPDSSAIKGAMKLLPLPKFLLFSQYQRMQGQVSLDQIQGKQNNNTLDSDDQVFIALCEMAGLTLEQAASLQDFEGVVSRFEGASNKISAEIFKYWSQNRFLKVIFRLDPALSGDAPPFNAGRIFRTRIYNQLHEVTVPFDDRSTGFVWFFSFLALFSQVKKRHAGKIILLLDEPGLSLHGKAQADLLRYFKERLTPAHQVIYTTHSPFMVPSENLMSVRTVEDMIVLRKEEQPEVHGTKVGGEILSTDKDTLFPLQAALGYEITQSLFIGAHTLLVEGPSDLLYLRAMSEIMRASGRVQLDRRWTICPAGSIDKVGAFMSLFGGNKLHVAVLTDFATGQKKKIDDFRRSKLLRDGHVLTVNTYAGQAEADIEDVLGSILYVSLVNACYSLSETQALPNLTDGSRIVKHAENHFRTLPATVAEFDHYTPAVYLSEHQSGLIGKLPVAEKDAALDRFERLIVDLNTLLPA